MQTQKADQNLSLSAENLFQRFLGCLERSKENKEHRPKIIQ